MACLVQGDSDLYGLGVRLSLYLTGLSAILSRLLSPTRTAGFTSALHVLTFSMTATLIKNVRQGQPAMLELYLVLSTTSIINLLLAVCGASFSGVVSAISTLLAGFLQFVTILWISWARRYSGLETYGLGCARTVRFFGVIDVTGRFAIFLRIAPILAFAILGIIVVIQAVLHVLIKSKIRKHPLRGGFSTTFFELNADEPSADWIRNLGGVLDGEQKQYNPIKRWHLDGSCSKKMWRETKHLSVLIVGLALSIWFTEDTLRLSNIDVSNDLLSSGQMLPLVVGIVSILSVFGGWVDDRLLNISARKLIEARKSAKPTTGPTEATGSKV